MAWTQSDASQDSPGPAVDKLYFRAFDVDRATGDIVVPIRAKLRVFEPSLFAITVEKPGGVVVSRRPSASYSYRT